MGIGHLAVGFASKRWAPRASLGWLMLAPVFVDLWWGLFILTGVEHARITPGITRSIPLDLYDIPWSHSIPTTLAWAALLAGIYVALHNNWRVAAILFAGVCSHWVLDWISHRPDMPIGIHGPYVGLALWNHPVLACAVEAALLAGGVALYLSVTRPTPRGGRIGLAIILALLFGSNLAVYFGPMPSTIVAPALGNLALAILCWGLARIDARRDAVAATP
jgi:hypothetical protein